MLPGQRLHETHGRPLGDPLDHRVPSGVLLGREVWPVEQLLQAQDLDVSARRPLDQRDVLVNQELLEMIDRRGRLLANRGLDEPSPHDARHRLPPVDAPAGGMPDSIRAPRRLPRARSLHGSPAGRAGRPLVTGCRERRRHHNRAGLSNPISASGQVVLAITRSTPGRVRRPRRRREAPDARPRRRRSTSCHPSLMLPRRSRRHGCGACS